MADIDVLEGDGAIIVVATVAGQNTFSFDFLAYTGDQVKVRLRPGTLLEADLDLGVDYSVAGLSQEAGGSITLIGSYAGVMSLGDQALIFRSTPIRRLFDYQNAGDFRAETLNREFDTMVMVDQENRRDVARAIKVPIGSPNIAITPGAAGVIPIFDDFGNLVPGPDGSDIAGAGAAAAAAVAAAADAAAAVGDAAAEADAAEAARDQTVSLFNSMSAFWKTTVALPGVVASWVQLQLKGHVATKASLKAIIPLVGLVVAVSDGAQSGEYAWTPTNLSAKASIDTLEAVYVKANSVAVSAGMWVRVNSNVFDIRWFGAKMDGGTNDGAAIQAAVDLAGAVAGASGGARAEVYAPPGSTIRLDAQVNITVPIRMNIRSYIVTALTAGFLFAVNPTVISASGNSGYDLYFEGLVGPGGAFPASRNNAGLTAFIIRSMIFSRVNVRYLSGFTRDAILCDGTGGTYTGGQQQSILHNTFDLGVVANNGYGFYALSLHAATHQFQGNRVKIQNCLQNFMGIVDGQAGFTASTSNTWDINALDNATSVGIDAYCPFNTFYVGFTGAPGTSLRLNGNDCDYNEFIFSNNLTTDIVLNNNGMGIHNTIRCKSPSNLPASQAVVSGTDYTNNYGCPISVTVPMTGTGTYQMIITNPQGGAYAISAVASGGLATFPTLHHGWKWKVFTTGGSIAWGGALILAA